MTSIQFQPLIPVALWLALAAAGAAALAWYAVRRPPIISPRCWTLSLALAAAALILVLIVLLNPIAVTPVPPPEGKPLLTILTDRSASMAVADQSGGRSRIQTAAEIAGRLQRDLSQTFDVELRSFADRTLSVSAAQLETLPADGQVTDLATPIQESLDDSREQGQALVMLSDGNHNAQGGVAPVRQVVEMARAMSIPIYASPIGGPTTVADIEVSLVRQQGLAFVGQKAPVGALIKQRGRLAGEIELTLADETGQQIERKTITLLQDGTAQATFQVTQDAAGLHRYQVRAQPLKGEATAGNNTSTFLLRTVDHAIRILLLEGKPYWDAKFLMRTLAHDDAVELDAVVRVADDRFLQRSLQLAPASENDSTAQRQETTEIIRGQPTLLASAEKLAEYQILVLGRDAEAFLTGDVLERLRTWISRDGGSLVCFRGQPVAKVNEQLARLMPVRWSPSPESRFRMQLTRLGQEVSWIAAASTTESDALAALPSLATSAQAQQPTPLAVVVAQSPGEGQPVVTYQPYGLGRVVAIEGAGMWRWAFMAPEHLVVESVYDSLWQGLMRWLVSAGGLAPGQDIALRTENVSFFTQEPAFATLLVREGAQTGELPRVELRHSDEPAGAFQPIAVGDEPGVYRVSFGPLAEGTYRARIAADLSGQTETSVMFDVRPNYSEELDTAARPDLLAEIAERSGGALLHDVDAKDVSRRFQEHLARARPLQLRETTLWDRWWVLLLVIGLWTTAWGLRRHAGLI